MKANQRLIIREAKGADVSSVYRMLCELEETELNEKAFKETWNRNIANRNIFYLVAVVGKAVVGFISIHIQTLLHHVGKVAEMQEIVVQKDFRSSGIGKKLVDRARKIVRQTKCELLEVACNMKRKAAHRFYEREGLKRTHYKFTKTL